MPYRETDAEPAFLVLCRLIEEARSRGIHVDVVLLAEDAFCAVARHLLTATEVPHRRPLRVNGAYIVPIPPHQAPGPIFLSFSDRVPENWM